MTRVLSSQSTTAAWLIGGEYLTTLIEIEAVISCTLFSRRDMTGTTCPREIIRRRYETDFDFLNFETRGA